MVIRFLPAAQRHGLRMGHVLDLLLVGGTFYSNFPPLISFLGVFENVHNFLGNFENFLKFLKNFAIICDFVEFFGFFIFFNRIFLA